MAQKGMDVEQVRSYGGQLRGSIRDSVSELQVRVQSDVQALQWTGADADQFKGTKLDDLNTAFSTLMERLDDLGQTAERNADAQDTTSTNV